MIEKLIRELARLMRTVIVVYNYEIYYRLKVWEEQAIE